MDHQNQLHATCCALRSMYHVPDAMYDAIYAVELSHVYILQVIAKQRAFEQEKADFGEVWWPSNSGAVWDKQAHTRTGIDENPLGNNRNFHWKVTALLNWSRGKHQSIGRPHCNHRENWIVYTSGVHVLPLAFKFGLRGTVW